MLFIHLVVFLVNELNSQTPTEEKKTPKIDINSLGFILPVYVSNVQKHKEGGLRKWWLMESVYNEDLKKK